MKLKKFMKMGSFSSKIAKFDAQRSLRAGLPVNLIGDQMRRASFVIAHVCDPNDIQRPFDMYHNAHYIRE